MSGSIESIDDRRFEMFSNRTQGSVGMRMKATVTGAIAVAAAAMVVLSGCSSSNTATTSSSAVASGSGSAAETGAADAEGKRACVMLPDADSSSRWENGDRPALQKGFEEAGYE